MVESHWVNIERLLEADGTIKATAIQMTFERMESVGTQLRINDLIVVYQRDDQGAWRFQSRTIERQMALEL
jgi:hypothetical protein